MPTECLVHLIKNGNNQALPIPREFELPGNEAIIQKEGDLLIIKPVKRSSLLALLASWGPLDIDFPDIDTHLPPLDDIVF